MYPILKKRLGTWGRLAARLRHVTIAWNGRVVGSRRLATRLGRTRPQFRARQWLVLRAGQIAARRQRRFGLRRPAVHPRHRCTSRPEGLLVSERGVVGDRVARDFAGGHTRPAQGRAVARAKEQIENLRRQLDIAEIKAGCLHVYIRAVDGTIPRWYLRRSNGEICDGPSMYEVHLASRSISG